MGTDSGGRPATPVPPAHLAKHDDAASAHGLDTNADAQDGGAYAGIEDVFRRQLSALRRLRPADRPHALRAARDERSAALRSLKERRAFARHADRLLRRLTQRHLINAQRRPEAPSP